MKKNQKPVNLHKRKRKRKKNIPAKLELCRDGEFDMQFCTETFWAIRKVRSGFCFCTKKLKETIPRRLSTLCLCREIESEIERENESDDPRSFTVTPWGIKNSNPRRVIALVNYTNGQERLELKYIPQPTILLFWLKRDTEIRFEQSARSKFLVHLFSVPVGD